MTGPPRSPGSRRGREAWDGGLALAGCGGVGEGMFKETVRMGVTWDWVTFSQVKRGEGGGLFVCWLLVSGVQQSDSVGFSLYFSHCFPL